MNLSDSICDTRFKGKRSSLLVCIGLVFVAQIFLSANLQAAATIRVWSGGGADNFWSTSANWGGTAPSATEALTFSGSLRLTSTNNLTAGTSFAGINFSAGAGAFNLNGNSIKLSGDIVNSGTDTTLQTINFDIALIKAVSFSMNSTSRLQVNGNISGGFALAVNDAGTVILTGSNSFTGGTTLSAGVLNIRNSNALGSAAVSISTAGAALELQGGITVGNAFSIRGTGVSSGGALRNVSDNNIYAGAITLAAATSIASDAGTLTLSNAISGNFAKTFQGAGNIAITGTMSGSGLVTKTGSGTLTLSTANTFSSGLTISGGTVRATTNAGALGNGTVTLSGGALSLANDTGLNFADPTAVSSNATIEIDRLNAGGGVTHSLGTLSIGAQNLSLTKGANVSSGTAGLTFGATTISASGASFTPASGVLLTLGSVAGTGVSFSVGGDGDTTIGGAIATGVGGLTKTGTGTLQLDGASTFTGTLSLQSGKLRATTSGSALGMGALAISGGSLELANDTGLNFGRNTTVSSDLTITSERLTSGTGVTHTLGTLGIGAQTLSVVKGSNVVDGTTAGLSFGATTLSASGARFSAGAGVLLTLGGVSGNGFGFSIEGAGDAAITGAITTGSGGVTKTSSGILTFSGTNTYSGTTTISLGTLQIGASGTTGSLGSGAVVNNGALVFNRSDSYGGNVGNVISGTGSLTLSNGALTLSATNSYSGVTNITGGTLRLGVAEAIANTSSVSVGAAGALDLNGLTIGKTVALSGTLLNSAAGDAIYTGPITLGAPAALVASGGNLTVTSTGTITGSGFGLTLGGNANGTLSRMLATDTGGLTKTGSGSWTLGAQNTYTGVTTLSSGTLSVSSIANGGVASNLGQATSDAANLVFAGGALQYTGSNASSNRGFTINNGATATIEVLANNLILTGTSPITTGGLTKIGAGTLTLGGLNGFTGLTTVGAGTLAYGISDALSSGGVTVSGGLLDLQSYSDSVGAVTLTSGTIAGTTGVLSGASYALQNGAVTAILGGTGALTKSTAATVNLSGANTFSGTTTVSAGVLNVSNASALGSTAAGTTVAAGAALELQGGISIGNEALSLSGSGVSSGGVLRNVSGNNTYGGLVTLGAASQITSNAGSLTLSNTGTITGPTFGLTVNGAGDTTINSIIGTTTGSLTKSGSGTLTLTGVNTFTGATALQGGKLRATTSGSALGAGTLSISGGVLELANDTGLAFNRNTTISADATVTSDRLTSGSGVTHTLGTLAIGAQTLTLSKGASIDSGTGGVTFGATTMSAAATFNTDAGTNLTLGAVSGAFALTKQGAGQLTLNTTSLRTTVAGVTNLQGGTLRLGVANALNTLATAPLNFSGGTLSLGVDSSSTFLGTATTISGDVSVESDRATTGGGVTATLGTLSIGANSLTVSKGSNVTSGTAGVTFGATTLRASGANFNPGAGTLLTLGAITGSGFSFGVGGDGDTYLGGSTTIGAGAITKSGSGSLTVAGANTAGTFTGGISVSGGTLYARASATALGSGTVTLSGGNLELDGDTGINFGAPLRVLADARVTADRATGVGAGVTHTMGALSIGAQTLTLAKGANITSGTAGITFGATSFTTGEVTFDVTSGVLLTLGAVNTAGYGFTVSGSGDTTISGAITGGTGAGGAAVAGLDKNGTGTLILGGTNSYAGVTTIGGGVLQVGAGGASGSLGGGAVVNNASLVFNRNDSYGGTLSNDISGTGSLTLNNGTLVLGGNNSYSGSTTVSAGTLKLGGTQSLGNTSAISVASGGALDLAGIAPTANAGLTISGTGTTGGALINTGTADVSYSAPITLSGAAGISASTGNLTLSNTISGANFGLTLGGAGNASGVTGVLSLGTGALTKTGAGKWTLSNANVYSGTTTISAGVLGITNADALGSAAAGTVVAAGAALELQGNISVATEALNISGTGSGSGALRNVSGNNSWGGLVTLGAASRINSDSGLLTLANTGTIAGPTFALTVGGAGDTLINSIIGTATGTLTKDGSGKLTLGAANTFTGLTTVNDGTLAYGIDNALSTGAVTVAGAVLDIGSYSDTIGAVTLNGGQIIGTSGVLSGASYTVTSGTVSANLGGGSLATMTVTNATLTGSNSYGGATSINAGGVLRIANSFALGSTANGTTVDAGEALELEGGISVGAEGLNLSGAGISSAGALRNVSGNNSWAGSVTLLAASSIASDADTLTVSGNVGGNFAKTFQGAGDIAVTGTIAGGGAGGAGNVTKTGSGTLTLSAANAFSGILSVNSGTVRATSNTAALGAGTLTLAGGALTLANDSGLNFGRNTTLTANAQITSDTLASGTGVTHTLGTLGMGAQMLTLAKGSNVSTGTAGLTFGAVTLSAGGAVFDANAGTLLTLGGFGGNTFGFRVQGAGDTTISGVIATTTGTLSKGGTGTLTLSAASTYTGVTTLESGTIVLNAAETPGTSGPLGKVAAATPGSIVLNGGFLQYTSVNANDYSGRFSTAANQRYNVDTNGRNVTWATALSSTGGTLSKTGSGTLTLSASNSYSGATTIGGGALSIAADNRLGLAPASATAGQLVLTGGTLATTASFTLNSNRGITAGGGIDVAAATELIYGGIAAGSGGLTKSGSGQLTLTGVNTYEGVTSISSGTLQIGNGTTDGSIAASSGITNNAALVYNLAGSRTYANVISGTGTLTKTGAGILTLSGSNTFTGATTISSGTLQIGNGVSDASIASSSGITNNGRLVYNTVSAGAYGNAISGTGALTKTGTGTLTLSGSNAFTGATFIESGILALGHAQALLGSGTITFAGGTLQYSGSSQSDYSGKIKNSGSTMRIDTNGQNVTFASAIDSSNSGGLTKTGSGVLTLSGSNSYTGITTISSGAVSIGADNRLGAAPGAATVGQLVLTGGTLATTASFTLNSNRGIVTGGAIDVAAGTELIYGGIAAGSGGLTKSGSGVLTLTGLNTYDGLTIITSGTLQIGNGTTDGSIAGSSGVSNNAALVYNLAGARTYSNVISGTGALIKTGAGSLTLTGSNSFTGATTISSGTLQIGDGVLDGSIASSSGITNNASLVYNLAGARTYANGISGTGSLTKTGNGTLTLSGSNAFTGATLIQSGTLALEHSQALLGTGTISFAGGALQYSGSNQGDYGAKIKNSSSAIRLNTNGQNVTFTGGIDSSNNGGLTKTGQGLLVLAGSNAYTGATTISSGTLQLGNGGTTGVLSASSAITNNARLVFNRSNTITQGSDFGTVSGTGGLTQSGSGTVVLTANNTYSGATTINSGTLQIGNGVVDASIANSSGITNNANLVYNTAGTVSYGRVISGSGAFIKSGTGTLTLAAENLYSGATTVGAGTLKLGSATALGSDSAAATVSSGAVLDLGGQTVGNKRLTLNGMGIANSGALVNNDGTVASLAGDISLASNSGVGGIGQTTLSGVISGSATGLTKLGSGIVILTGSNTYTGATNVSAGKLTVNGSLAAGSAVSVSTGAILSGTGRVGGTVTVADSATATILVGDGSSGRLTLGNLSFSGAGKIQFGTLSNYTSNAALTLTGSLTLNGGSVVLALPSGGLDDGTYHLISHSGTSINLNGLSVSGPAIGVRQFAELKNNGGFLDYVVGGDTPYWTGANNSSWDTSTNNWKLVKGGGTTQFISGDSVLFDDNANGSGRVTVNIAQTVNPVAVTFNNNTRDYLLTGSAGIGTGSLTKSGSGKLTITNANSYSDVTILGSTGILEVGNDRALGSGTINFNGGKLSSNSGTARTISNAILINGDVTLGDSINNGALTFTGNVDLDSVTRAFDIASDVTFSGNLFGIDGGLYKTGAGLLKLSGSNIYTGDTVINAGTLTITSSNSLGNSASMIQFTGNSTLRLDASFNANRDVVIHSGVTATIDTNGNQYKNYGSFSGDGDLVKTGAGSMILTGTNFFFTGAAFIQSGTLQIGDGVTDGCIGNTSGVFNLGTFKHVLLADRACNYTISGTGDFIKDGPATLTLAGSNTYTGSTTINSGTLQIGDGTTDGSIASSSSIRNNGVLVYNLRNSEVLSHVISGSGSLTKNGQGTLTLAGGNTYTGATRVNGGVLSISDDSSLGAAPQSATPAKLVLNGGTLAATESFTLNGNRGLSLTAASAVDIAAGKTMAFGGIASGTGSLRKTGQGTLAVSGVNTYSGATIVSEGKLSISSDSGLGTAPAAATEAHLILDGGTLATTADFSLSSNRGVELTKLSTFEVASSTTLTYGGVLSGIGGFAKTGEGTLKLLGRNTFDGPINLYAGTIEVNSVLSLGEVVGGDLNFLGNSTLKLSQDAGTIISDRKYNIAEGKIATVDTNGASLEHSGTISGTGSLNKIGEGTLTLSGSNSQTDTTITGGRLAVGNANALGNAAGHLAMAGGVLDLGGYNLTRTGTVSFTGGTVEGGTLSKESGAFEAQGGIISAGLGGSAGLNKTGTGTLTLSANNSYTGETKLTEGTVIVTGSLSGSSLVEVGADTKLVVNGALNAAASVMVSGTLGGSGSVGAITMGSGGSVSPGNSPGILSATSFTGTSSASLSIEITKTTAGLNTQVAGTDYDRLNVAGEVALNGIELKLSSSNSFANIQNGDLFFILINGGVGNPGVFGNVNTTDTPWSGGVPWISLDGQSFLVSYQADLSSGKFYDPSGNDVALFAIPEPNAALMLISGLGMLMLLQRRRRKL